jgi:Fic family protein
MPEKYRETHGWIDFKFDFNKIDPKTWLQLGQIQAKCAQISGIPMLPSVADQMHQLFLAKGALATTAIEGNTLTEDEVLRLLSGELHLPASKEYLATEIQNILDAMVLIADRILNNEPSELRPDDIKNYNQMVLKDLATKEEVVPGEYRSYDVRVLAYKGAPPEDVPYLVKALCDWLNSWDVPAHLKIAAGILKAIIAHVYIAWIHPFGDGNGRTARLIEMQILLALGFPTPTTHLLSNHYNQTRSEYYRYLDMTSKREHGLHYFIAYALQGFLDNLDEQIRLIEAQQLAVHWQSYVHSLFRNRDSKPDIRKRQLVLDLSQKPEPVPLAELRHVSPRIAEAYAGKTDKTVQRDISELVGMGLVIRTPGGIQANTEIMRAFLPQKRIE